MTTHPAPPAPALPPERIDELTTALKRYSDDRLLAALGSTLLGDKQQLVTAGELRAALAAAKRLGEAEGLLTRCWPVAERLAHLLDDPTEPYALSTEVRTFLSPAPATATEETR